MRRLLIAVVSAMVLAGPCLAVTPDEQMADPALEARARSLSLELRCVVCQNQSIDESDAALARDLRTILRERLAAGDSDDQAKDYLVQRYGSYVLLRPPLNGETLALWLGPLAVLALGGLGAMVYLRGRSGGGEPAPLDATERAELAKLMNTDEAS